MCTRLRNYKLNSISRLNLKLFFSVYIQQKKPREIRKTQKKKKEKKRNRLDTTTMKRRDVIFFSSAGHVNIESQSFHFQFIFRSCSITAFVHRKFVKHKILFSQMSKRKMNSAMVTRCKCQ